MRSIGRWGGWSRQTGVNEQGLPQVTNSELIANLEAILLELRHRLDNYLELGTRDLVAADEGFNFAGQLQPTLTDASEYAVRIRERLDEIQRAQSQNSFHNEPSPLSWRLPLANDCFRMVCDGLGSPG